MSQVLKDTWRFMVPAVCTGTRGERGDGQGLGLAARQGSWGRGVAVKVKVAQLCPTVCDPTDYTANEILQARILEWVAVPSSRGSSQPRDQTQVSHIAGGFFTS